jgi:hypothetical protein
MSRREFANEGVIAIGIPTVLFEPADAATFRINHKLF